MAASEAAVTAAQAKAGCWFEETVAGLFCNAHHCYADQRHETRSECDVIASIADAAVDADRASIQADTLREFAGHDLHNVIPYSEIANDWYHRGLIAAQEEAGLWADRIEAV